MRNLILFFVFFLFLPFVGKSSIFCPPNKSMVCSDDIHNLDIMGRPILLGNSLGKQARFVDDWQTNICHVGFVYRKWYVDDNQDSKWQSNELFCTQEIYLAYEGIPVTIQFPSDKIYDCKEDIIFENPIITNGPCNVIGSMHTDQVFEVANDACYKILRTYRFLDWCDADGDGQMDQWEHTQVIKVIDNNAPQIQQCAYQEYHVGADCKAEIILENIAIDNQACGNQKLTWTVLVDLWGNGTYDHEFSNLKTGDFFIAPVNNSEQVSIKIPERVGLGYHKVYWNVRDDCGNIKSCHSDFRVVDKKPPTPYLHTFLTASFDATSMPLMVPASIFNVGSFDNCSPKNKLSYSFSEDVNDTIRIVDCTNAGFQFFTLYVTDMMGNSDFIDVYLLVFDNGSCSATQTLHASLLEGNGRTIANAKISASRENLEIEAVEANVGSFEFVQMPLYDDYIIQQSLPDLIDEEQRINIQDLIWLQEYLFGKRSLFQFEYVAADVDLDNRIRSKDLILLRQKLLSGLAPFMHGQQYNVVFEPGEINPHQLAQFQSQGSARDYDGSFDFKAVLLGDITGANSIETEKRKSATIMAKQEGHNVHFFLSENISYKGLQIEIAVGKDGSVLSSLTLPLQQQSYVYDEVQKVHRLVILEEGLAVENVPLFTLENTFLDQINWSKDNGLVDANGDLYSLLLNRMDNINQTKYIYPNPIVGQTFFVEGEKQIYLVQSQTGQSIPFQQMGNKVVLEQTNAHHVVFVYVKLADGSTSIQKLIKL
ncbi:MAG: dockerin type I repeat-containing protein [Saprospiraceae bacterium]